LAKPSSLSSIVFIGNYVPRQCGIATFTSDLCESVAQEAGDADCYAVAMNDIAEGYDYPERVRFEVPQRDPEGYRQLADFINMGGASVVCLQHEYGIFGGPAGADLLLTLRRLRVPIVTTLHTVLREPNEDQRRVMDEICRLSDRLVVMSERAVGFLREVWSVPEWKIEMIHHGIPDMPFVDPNYYKDKFGVEGRRVILTFGLLSPNKGIENMIDALPEIVRRYPDAMYIVLGATHPHVRREHGEEYRLGLSRRARSLGVQDNIVFHNRFVDIGELCEFLGSADAYVTPYLNEEQITSGTLAYALGTGKAVVSTPYWYANDLLAEGRGVIVPFRDPAALAEKVCGLFDNEVERHAMRKRAYTFGRQMVWREVSRRYLDAFERAREERRQRPKSVGKVATLGEHDVELPELDLSHLKRLSDMTGMFQHARFSIPNYAEGYTTDDNARALMVAVAGREFGPTEPELRVLASRYLAFLNYAFIPAAGRFHNFMSYDRRWLDECGTEDCQGRSVMACGWVVNLSPDEGLVAAAMNLLAAALPATELFTSPRAWAYTLLGLDHYLRRFPGDSNARRMREVLAARLHGLYQANAQEGWRWFEQSLSYANARLPHALLVAGHAMGRPEMVADALAALDWLAGETAAPAGHFVPIGSNGWFRRGGERARFAQQPIEAQTMIDAGRAAYQATSDARWWRLMVRTFEWFFGRNDLGLPLYDYTTGGCHDGLEPDRVSLNQGAESVLSYLLARLTMGQTKLLVEESK
jgi:glycosyltransferase involved in cell wall biosynthesis